MSGDDTIEIRCKLNGEGVKRRAHIRQTLASFLRSDMGLAGMQEACSDGNCAACSVRLDGKVVRSCMMLAVQADRCSIVTIEALARSGEIADLQAVLAQRQAMPCENCRPGILFTAAELLAEGEPSTREEIESFMAGNECQCGSLEPVIDAIEATMKKRAGIA